MIIQTIIIDDRSSQWIVRHNPSPFRGASLNRTEYTITQPVSLHQTDTAQRGGAGLGGFLAMRQREKKGNACKKMVALGYLMTEGMRETSLTITLKYNTNHDLFSLTLFQSIPLPWLNAKARIKKPSNSNCSLPFLPKL
ncbi:hypothetical protein HZ326_1041 [Fusarium oxysporum f. sp. albedinis]|nr:hypothetical protein HZ326_1041 [Fusarium oxysporum f. sp. albedinis]